MKQVLIRQGQAIVEEVPAPQVEPGAVLVMVQRSCISIGTEMSGLKKTGMPLWKRALKRPEHIRRVVQMITTEGIGRTRLAVEGKLSAAHPTGYSAAGLVLEVGEGVTDLKPGDRVACAGAQCAHHAEVIRVPRNLTVLLPNAVDFASGSTVTLGAIAMQGVRRAGPTLGETFVVLGLGILGQLTVQLLKANGCRVIGTDLDPQRIAVARDHGLDMGVDAEAGPDIDQVARFTGGIGADGVIITAASPSDALISTAFKMCRKKGRVVLVGDVGLHLNRADFYEKEIDFFISSSYGPGRYDYRYEEEGLDYPVAYVRWTENRNMEEYVRLLSERRVDVRRLISASYSVVQAPDAYKALQNQSSKPLMVLLEYPDGLVESRLERKIVNPGAPMARSGRIRVALVGAGAFAKGVHLPNMQALSDRYQLHAVMSKTGHNATDTARQFGAAYSTTDFQEVLDDPATDLVLITTRHHLHAEMALAALKAGKNVLVEKPMALASEELGRIEAFFASVGHETRAPLLLTGFNRRFSPFAQRLHQLVARRSNPMILNYRMNAGYIPLDHWVHGPEGGGRNKGEACHIYDLFTFLTGAKVVDVTARAIRPQTSYYSRSDNFVATLTFADGSVATLTYTGLGSKDFPKEQMEVFVDGQVFSLNDYKQLTLVGSKAKGIQTKVAEKGQKEELEVLAGAIQNGQPWPIPLWQQIQASDIALRVDAQLG